MSEHFHAKKLLRELQRLGKKLSPLLILTHDHPDPDSLASAWSLAHLAQQVGKIRVRIAYGGIIGRRENRMMAERLLIPAYPLRKGEVQEAEHVALVDTQPPFKNNRFPPRRKPDIIIDHHPKHADTEAGLALIDESAGATTTMLAEALLISGVRVPPKLATAIVYGIGSETQNLGREATARDREAYQSFFPKANMKALWHISYPKRSAVFFSDVARGTTNAFTVRSIVGTHLGPIITPDRVAQIADFLLTWEKARWCIVTGRYAGRLHVSLRTTDPAGEAGRLLKRLLGGGNRGGGHGMIAGGHLEIGEDAPEKRWQEAEEKVASDFLESQGIKETGARTHPFREGGA
jgi:nanoRNase/pAp phosphatase (c-di-AMP/oligoRNAs hydrolase)